MKIRILVLTALMAFLNGPAVQAHHAGTAFDSTVQLTIAGTIKEFKWVNPHIWAILEVPDENGNIVEWKLEGGSVSILGRSGWNSKSLQPGDKVTVTVSPLRSGEPGGEFHTFTKEDGTVLGMQMR